MTKILLFYFFSIVHITIETIEGIIFFSSLIDVYYLVLSTCEVSWSYNKKLSIYLFSKFLPSLFCPTSKMAMDTPKWCILSCFVLIISSLYNKQWGNFLRNQGELHQFRKNGQKDMVYLTLSPRCTHDWITWHPTLVVKVWRGWRFEKLSQND